MSPFSPDISVFMAAIGIDLAIGEYPEIVHPVVWMGRITGIFDIKSSSKLIRFASGSMLLTSDTALWFLVAAFSFKLPFYLSFMAQIFLLKATFSIRALYEHTLRCQTDDIAKMRNAVSMMVSRNTSGLDKSHLISAALESLSENISDSIASPLFYYVIFGLPAAMAYRTINTLDAMIGYHTESFEFFGKTAAIADDIINFIPSRITALIIALFSPVAAFRSMRKYARVKLNAAYPMAAASGVLGVWFEKKGFYRFDGREPQIYDIKRGLKLFRLTVAVILLLAMLSLW